MPEDRILINKRPSWSGRQLSFRKTLLLITIVALIARLIVLFYNYPVKLRYDEIDYYMLAKNLHEKQAFVAHELTQTQYQGGEPGEPTAYRTPVLPAFIAGHFYLFGENMLMPRISLVLISAACCIFIGLLGRLAFNARTGLIAAAIWALYPPTLFSWFSADRLFTENLGIFFIIVSYYYLFLLYRKYSFKTLLISSLFFGLAILTRGYLALTLPLVCVFLLLFSKEKKFQTAFLFGFFASLILVGWMARNYVQMGKPVLSTQTDAFFWGNNDWTKGSLYGDVIVYEPWKAPQVQELVKKYPDIDELSEIKLSEVFTHEGFLYAKTHPGRTLLLMIKKTAIYILPFQLWEGGIYKYHYVYGLLLIGVIFAFWVVKSRREYFLLLLPFFGGWITTLLTVAMDRYRYAIEPLIIIIGVYGLLELVKRLKARNTKFPQPTQLVNNAT